MARSRTPSAVLALIGVSVLLAAGNAPGELIITRQFVNSEYPPTMMTGMMGDMWPVQPDIRPVYLDLSQKQVTLTINLHVPDNQRIEVNSGDPAVGSSADVWAFLWRADLPDIRWPDPAVDGVSGFVTFPPGTMGMPPTFMDGCTARPDGASVLWSFSPGSPASPTFSFTDINLSVDLPNGLPNATPGEYYLITYPVITDPITEDKGGLTLYHPSPDGYSIMAPEPTTVFLFGAAALPLLRRRRRKTADK